MLKGLWVLDFCVQLVLHDLSRGGVLPLNKVQLHLCCDNTACVCVVECSVINKIPCKLLLKVMGLVMLLITPKDYMSIIIIQ